MKPWLSYRDVITFTTLSESTIRRLIREGRFPAPEELTTGRKIFHAEAVEQAINKLLAERRQARGCA